MQTKCSIFVGVSNMFKFHNLFINRKNDVSSHIIDAVEFVRHQTGEELDEELANERNHGDQTSHCRRVEKNFVKVTEII